MGFSDFASLFWNVFFSLKIALGFDRLKTKLNRIAFGIKNSENPELILDYDFNFLLMM